MIILKFVLLDGENGLSLICWHINILDASYVSLQNPKPRIHEKHQNIQDLIDSKLEKSESLREKLESFGKFTGWWFQIYTFYFHPYFGEDSRFVAASSGGSAFFVASVHWISVHYCGMLQAHLICFGGDIPT